MAGEGISTDLLVSILHHGDSSFPSGGFAFSSGLEGFFIDQMINNVAELESFIADLLINRWIGFDAVALRRGYAAASDIDLAEIDRCVEIATLSAAQRAGSKRAGRAVLAVYAKLGSKAVSNYRDRTIADEELGHLPVAQGLAWREAGLPIEAALVMSAWTMVQGLATAAIRLGLIGHLQAQHLLFGMRAQVVAAVQSGADYPSMHRYRALPSSPISRWRGMNTATRGCSSPKAAGGTMNLTPTEIDRLIIFNAAEFARRHQRLGIRLSRPEAVALIADEMLLAARRNMPYVDIVDMAGRLLTTDDVEPGVGAMIDLISVEGNFEEGTKLIVVFAPIGPGASKVPPPVPGEIITPDEDIELNGGRQRCSIKVLNMGDRDIQVRSHAHFFEANPALHFDRTAAFGMKIDKPSGVGVRFEPGVSKVVDLVALGGSRIVSGQAGLVEGPLDAPGALNRALEATRSKGYRGC